MFDEALEVIEQVLDERPGTSAVIVVPPLVRAPGQLPMQVLEDLCTALAESTRASAEERIRGLSALTRFMTTWRGHQDRLLCGIDELRELHSRLLPLKGRV